MKHRIYQLKEIISDTKSFLYFESQNNNKTQKREKCFYCFPLCLQNIKAAAVMKLKLC